MNISHFDKFRSKEEEQEYVRRWWEHYRNVAEIDLLPNFSKDQGKPVVNYFGRYKNYESLTPEEKLRVDQQKLKQLELDIDEYKRQYPYLFR